MAELPAYHGRTHAPGGTDPVPMQLAWCLAYRDSSQTIDNNAEEVAWTRFATNAPEVFELDTSGTKSGILVKQEAMYQVMGQIDANLYQTTDRGISVQALPESSYPTFGTEFGFPGGLSFDTSQLDQSNIRQNFIAFGSMSGGTPGDRTRVILTAERMGGITYDLSTASLVIYRIGDYAEPSVV